MQWILTSVRKLIVFLGEQFTSQTSIVEKPEINPRTNAGHRSTQCDRATQAETFSNDIGNAKKSAT